MNLLGALITSTGLGYYGITINSLLLVIPMIIASLIFLFGIISVAIIPEKQQP